MPLQYILLAGIDIGIIVLLLLIFFRNARERDSMSQDDLLKIKSLGTSLKKAMADSERVSNELLASFEDKTRELNGIIERIEYREKRLKKYISKAETLLNTIDETETQVAPPKKDPYKMAADLILQGLSHEDVQRKSGLSLSEIDLIKNITQYRAQ